MFLQRLQQKMFKKNVGPICKAAVEELQYSLKLKEREPLHCLYFVWFFFQI